MKSFTRGVCLVLLMTVAATAQKSIGVQAGPKPDVHSAGWATHVVNGHRTKTDVQSPNHLWHLHLTPVKGLDVATFKVTLQGKTGPAVDVCAQALDATFSPDSRLIFVSTGPRPLMYVIKIAQSVPLSIDSGLENNPVWVSKWSGNTLELHQQARFDSASKPRTWTVKIH